MVKSLNTNDEGTGWLSVCLFLLAAFFVFFFVTVFSLFERSKSAEVKTQASGTLLTPPEKETTSPLTGCSSACVSACLSSFLSFVFFS